MLTSLLSEDDSDSTSHLLMGKVLLLLRTPSRPADDEHSTDRILHHLRRAVELDPLSAEANIHIAYVLAEKHSDDDADLHFKRALALSKKHHEYYYKYAKFLARTHRTQDALKYGREAIKFGPTIPLYRVAYGEIILQHEGPVCTSLLCISVHYPM
jgi:tetratricopeptide (TPR) repeat protein